MSAPPPGHSEILPQNSCDSSCDWHIILSIKWICDLWHQNILSNKSWESDYSFKRFRAFIHNKVLWLEESVCDR